MDEVALLVQHDVAVVPVLDLQQEQQEAVGSHAADEVVACLRGRGAQGLLSSRGGARSGPLPPQESAFLRPTQGFCGHKEGHGHLGRTQTGGLRTLGAHLLEGQRGLVSVLACEVVIHAEVGLAAQLVPGGAVGDALDDPTLGRKGQAAGTRRAEGQAKGRPGFCSGHLPRGR